MHLSDTEEKLVGRLRKQQQSMIRWRWAGLLGAFICLAVGIYGFACLEHFSHDPSPPSLLAIAILIPTIYVMSFTGVFLLVYILWGWNGRPETCLLLKLIDEAREGNAAEKR